jgi:DNA-binding Xre family transcriptional regulator
MDVNFKEPNYYAAVLKARALRFDRIRSEGPRAWQALRAYYRERPWALIDDWGITFDPRNPEVGLPAIIPFVLYPRQREWLEWAVAHWRARKSCLTDKSREVGLSWLAISLAAALSILYDNVSFGFGSRKEEYVDKTDEPKSLFHKARMFVEGLPIELRAGWRREADTYMHLVFPETGSVISGEAGANIGRGDRRSIYIVDEAAFLERPLLVDAALSMTTNCRIDISSANGPSNPFATKRHSMPPEDVFTFHWRDDPRKDEAWYARKCAEINNSVIVASELDINYHASVEQVLIPSEWIQSAIDAHVKLGFEPRGRARAGLDVVDEGRDLNAFVAARGILIERVSEWSGKNSDIFKTTERAISLCDEEGLDSFRYDGDGIGADVRGDARVINERRAGQGLKAIRASLFLGSGAVVDPEREDIKGRKNEDMFLNAKAQAWMRLKRRFELTHLATTTGIVAAHDDLISISSAIPAGTLRKLCSELAQPTMDVNGAGKVIIDKAPAGARSPNMADAVMICFAPDRAKMSIPAGALAAARGRRAA